MSARRYPPDDAREWLNRARSSLLQARHRLAGVYLEDLCFNPQQAAAKALKALFLARNLAFPYTHDLARLIALLESQGVMVPSHVRTAAELSQYAVEARYPGFAEPISEEEYDDAVAQAEAVLL